jgi:hypothetical protein
VFCVRYHHLVWVLERDFRFVSNLCNQLPRVIIMQATPRSTGSPHSLKLSPDSARANGPGSIGRADLVSPNRAGDQFSPMNLSSLSGKKVTSGGVTPRSDFPAKSASPMSRSLPHTETSPLGGSEVAEAFKAQVLAECAAKSSPVAEQYLSAFGTTPAEPCLPPVTEDSILQVEPSDVGEVFRAQVLAACSVAATQDKENLGDRYILLSPIKLPTPEEDEGAIIPGPVDHVKSPAMASPEKLMMNLITTPGSSTSKGLPSPLPVDPAVETVLVDTAPETHIEPDIDNPLEESVPMVDSILVDSPGPEGLPEPTIEQVSKPASPSGVSKPASPSGGSKPASPSGVSKPASPSSGSKPVSPSAALPVEQSIDEAAVEEVTNAPSKSPILLELPLPLETIQSSDELPPASPMSPAKERQPGEEVNRIEVAKSVDVNVGSVQEPEEGDMNNFAGEPTKPARKGKRCFCF